MPQHVPGYGFYPSALSDRCYRQNYKFPVPPSPYKIFRIFFLGKYHNAESPLYCCCNFAFYVFQLISTISKAGIIFFTYFFNNFVYLHLNSFRGFDHPSTRSLRRNWQAWLFHCHLDRPPSHETSRLANIDTQGDVLG